MCVCVSVCVYVCSVNVSVCVCVCVHECMQCASTCEVEKIRIYIRSQRNIQHCAVLTGALSPPHGLIREWCVCLHQRTVAMGRLLSVHHTIHTASIPIHKVVPHRLTCLVMLAGTSVCMLASTTDCGREETISLQFIAYTHKDGLCGVGRD